MIQIETWVVRVMRRFGWITEREHSQTVNAMRGRLSEQINDLRDEVSARAAFVDEHLFKLTDLRPSLQAYALPPSHCDERDVADAFRREILTGRSKKVVFAVTLPAHVDLLMQQCNYTAVDECIKYLSESVARKVENTLRLGFDATERERGAK